MFKRHAALLLAVAISSSAQTPLENSGKPMRVGYECTAADTQAAGLGCSEEDPCPVYLELANVDAVGGKIFVTGNLHTPMATLLSILLASSDGGNTWTEPHPRLRLSGLDQIQFVDFQNGWISGANLQSAPRDPFFLITTDGGKMWREQPIFEETRVSAIESFYFDTPTHWTMARTRFTRPKTVATSGAFNQAPPKQSNTPLPAGGCEPTPPRIASSSRNPRIIVGKRSPVSW
jgi:hypothetical protein